MSTNIAALLDLFPKRAGATAIDDDAIVSRTIRGACRMLPSKHPVWRRLLSPRTLLPPLLPFALTLTGGWSIMAISLAMQAIIHAPTWLFAAPSHGMA